jgi:hypothetical protein
VKHSGEVTIVYESVAGESLVPDGAEGILSPFRAKLLLLLEVTAGEFRETITLGIFRVDGVLDAWDTTATISDRIRVPQGAAVDGNGLFDAAGGVDGNGLFDVVEAADVNGLFEVAGTGALSAATPGREVVVGSTVRLSISALEADVARAGFHDPEQPASLGSTFDELRRILPMPVLETVTDKAIPAALVYEARSSGRLRAAQDLCRNLGGVGMVDPTGNWVIVPDDATGAAVQLWKGQHGTVTDVPNRISTDEAYTTVVGDFETADRKPIRVTLSHTTGPLAPSEQYPEHVKYITDDQVKTRAAAVARVQDELAKTLRQRFDVAVQCVTNPLVELGDPVEVLEEDETVLLSGRAVRYRLSDSALMSVTVEATRDL